MSAFSLAVFLQEPASKKSIPGAGLDFFATGPSSTITGVICFTSYMVASKGAALLSWSTKNRFLLLGSRTDASMEEPVGASSVQNLRFRSKTVVFSNDGMTRSLIWKKMRNTKTQEYKLTRAEYS